MKKSKFHQQLHHNHELEHLCNIYAEIKHYTFLGKSVKTINSNNSAKFEVNWRRGSQFTVRHTKNRLQFDEQSPITLE